MQARRVLLAAAAAAALALAGCGGDDEGGGAAGGGDAEGEPIKIGVVVPLSGPYASAGQEVFRGYELAVEKAGGTVAGRKIELVRGDAFEPDDAIAETQRLATRENVDLFVGTYATPASQAGSEAAQRANKVWWETHAITDSLTDRGLENYIRSGTRADNFANASVDFVKNGLAERFDGKPKVFLEHEDGPYGTSVAETQTKALKAAGYEVVSGKHSAAATDVTDSVLAAKRADPDVWMITGYVPDDNLLLRTAKSQGFDPPATVLVGTGDGRETYEAVGGEDLAGTFVVAYSTPLSKPEWAPGSEEWLSAYKAKYKSDPIGTVSMTGYTGMTAALQAIEAAGGKTDIATFRKAALSLDVPEGELPNGWGLKFDEKGQNTRIRHVTVQWTQDGEVPAVYPEQAAVREIREGV
jgi:branched-chain amino acid transport system substrate-binding protein